MTERPPGPAPAPRRRPLLWAALGVGMAALVALVVCEAQAWPFLAKPAQAWLSQRLGRAVSFDSEAGNTFRLKLLGGIRLSVGHLRVDNPAWVTQGPMLEGESLALRLRWIDALRWRPDQTLVLQSLSADHLALRLVRDADGRASWVFGTRSPGATVPLPTDLVQVAQLSVARGSVQVEDAPLQLSLAARFTLADGLPLQESKTASAAASKAASATASTAAPAQVGALPALAASAAAAVGPAGAAAPALVLQASADGRYRGKPLKATLRAGSPLAWWSRDAQAPAVPVSLALSVGRVELTFDGQTRHPLSGPELSRPDLSRPDLSGHYRLSGPSLAAIGDPVGVTLPQTHSFAMTGRLARAGPLWSTVVDQATVGASRLAGEFVHDRTPGRTPRLDGRLRGAALLMQDLGPALGGVTADLPKPVRGRDRVLSDRNFDLPALRAMNANVLVDLARFDFGTPQLQAVAPLRAHLQLQDGVLAINNLDARLAQGRLTGHIRLDGRQDLARWDVDLRGRDLRLEQWVRAVQRSGGPPYATGRLGGRVALTGRGNSTAALLASADGSMQLHWSQGGLSHLVVEAAGLDVAQALGVLVRGDQLLPVQCGIGDLAVKSGRVTPTVLLVDTADSLLWVDGSASLATEQLALTAHVRPKDWSPLSLRSPVHIDGVLSNPRLSLDKPQLLQRVLPAALLGLANPLLALLPLMDLGERDDTTQGCRAVVQRYRAAVANAKSP